MRAIAVLQATEYAMDVIVVEAGAQWSHLEVWLTDCVNLAAMLLPAVAAALRS